VTTTRVVLAEDQPMVRAGFRALLDSRSDIEVVGEAATGVEALEQVRALHPDVVVMDIRMPEMDGLEATRRITTDPALSRTRVLVLTTFELDEYVFGTLDAGASGFLLKGLDELTTREREVLGLVATGLTNAEIAKELHLSPLTAKTHVSRILTKLGARDRVQLVVIAYKTGIVDP
jgi:DNA-binding NarL/FixJ family response regulator